MNLAEMKLAVPACSEEDTALSPAFTCGLRDVAALVAAAAHRDDQIDFARGLASARAAYQGRKVPKQSLETIMAAREIPGLATVLGRIDGAMAPAAAWCERHGVSHMYELKELGDDGEIEEFMNAAGLNLTDFQNFSPFPGEVVVLAE